MIETLITLYFANAFTDAVNLYILRDLVYSFLLSKRKPKDARKIHKEQTKRDRFTLSYIKSYAIYPKEFIFFS